MRDKASALEQEWPEVLDGDRDAFHRLIEPHMNELIHAARRDIRYHRELRDLHRADLSPEELVGETILRAWHGRRSRPQWMSFRAWMFGLQHRVLQKLIRTEHLGRNLWAVSLEERVPPEPLFDDEESFWEWYQPDDLMTWEDVLSADQAPADVMPDETVDEPALRQVLLLHDEHALSLAEVAVTLGRTVRETSALLERARESLGESPGR